MKIVIGIAHGLNYLYTEVEPLFTISELNSSVVYLMEDFSHKICPLVMARSLPLDKHTLVMHLRKDFNEVVAVRGSRTDRRTLEFGKTHVLRPKGKHQSTIVLLHDLRDNGLRFMNLVGSRMS
ncbi:hypothetical protein RYX36_007447 [Vicia faba]